MNTTLISYVTHSENGSRRKYQPAIHWLNSQQQQRYTVTAITWMEVMEGTTSKPNQAQSKATLDHLEMTDCLIASVAYRLNVPLYTHNLKDMTPLIGSLAVKPYA